VQIHPKQKMFYFELWRRIMGQMNIMERSKHALDTARDFADDAIYIFRHNEAGRKAVTVIGLSAVAIAFAYGLTRAQVTADNASIRSTSVATLSARPPGVRALGVRACTPACDAD
jgi:hypothetical protein